jgi:hypothetical protein
LRLGSKLLTLICIALSLCASAFAESEKSSPDASVVLLSLEKLSGDAGKSLNGAYAYALGFKKVVGQKSFSWVFGGAFGYAPGNLTVASTDYTSALYFGEFQGGFMITPAGRKSLSPFVEAYATLGTASLEVASPPTGVNGTTRSLTYGYQAGFGVLFPMGKKRARLSASYISRKASSLANVTDFQLNSISFGLGLEF